MGTAELLALKEAEYAQRTYSEHPEACQCESCKPLWDEILELRAKLLSEQY